jgi:hypothetical protein
MGKQDGEESHASSIKSLIEFWEIGLPPLLDTGDSSSSTQVEPQESEEETDGENNNFHERMAHTFT